MRIIKLDCITSETYKTCYCCDSDKVVVQLRHFPFARLLALIATPTPTPPTPPTPTASASAVHRVLHAGMLEIDHLCQLSVAEHAAFHCCFSIRKRRIVFVEIHFQDFGRAVADFFGRLDLKRAFEPAPPLFRKTPSIWATFPILN